MLGFQPISSAPISALLSAAAAVTPPTVAQTIPAFQRHDDPWRGPVLNPSDSITRRMDWIRTTAVAWPVALQPWPKSVIADAAPVLDVRQVDRGQFGWIRTPSIAWPARLQPIAKTWDPDPAPGLDVRQVDRPQFGWIRTTALAWPPALQPWPKSQITDAAQVLDVRDVGQRRMDWLFTSLPVPTLTTAQLAGIWVSKADAGIANALDVREVGQSRVEWIFTSLPVVPGPTVAQLAGIWGSRADAGIASGLEMREVGLRLEWLFTAQPPSVSPAQLAGVWVARLDAWAAEALHVEGIDRAQPGWIVDPSLIWPAALAAGIRSGAPTVAGPVLDVRSIVAQNIGWLFSIGPIPPVSTDTYTQWHHHHLSHG